MQKNILILEDNQMHLNALTKIINDLHLDVKVFCVNTLDQAFQIVLKQYIHVFLVDIILDTQKSGDVSGLNFVEEIRGISKYKFTPVIFITSLEDPKLYSYSQLHCYGYIEKPFSVSQVRDTILSVMEFPCEKNDNRYVYFRKDGIVYSVRIKDIVYIQSTRRKIRVVCVNDELEIPYKTREEILVDLNSDDFIPCSRYFIINKNYVEVIDYANRYIKLKNVDNPVEIGAVMKKSFKKMMENE